MESSEPTGYNEQIQGNHLFIQDWSPVPHVDFSIAIVSNKTNELNVF